MTNEELIKLYKKGDRQSLDTLVNQNLGLVGKSAKKFLNRGYEYDDLFQMGCVGLMKSINNFDIEKSCSFTTYAVPTIEGEIKNSIRDDMKVHTSRDVRITATKLKAVDNKLCCLYGRNATLEELAEELNVDKHTILDAYNVCNIASLNTVINKRTESDKNIELVEKIHSDYSYEKVIDKLMLEKAINNLSITERKALVYSYIKGLHQQEIAKKMKTSQVNVSRNIKKAITNLRKELGSKNIDVTRDVKNKIFKLLDNVKEYNRKEQVDRFCIMFPIKRTTIQNYIYAWEKSKRDVS